MNRYVIASKHAAFGKMYLGRLRPVAKKASALSFGSKESAQARIDFWTALIEKDDLDPKFFGNLYVEVR